MNKEKAIKTSILSLLGNISLAVIKGITGVFGNSYALIADAIESTVDAFSSLMVLLGLKYSTRPPDKNHPYGHGKAETLVTFAVVGFLIISAVVIAYQSIENIRTPHELPKSYTLIVLAGIILVKEAFFRVVLKRSKETNSSSLEADAWHHRSDAITSVMAFIGISIALIMGKGWESADDWAALIASGIIMYNAYNIFRPALGEMMDENIHHEVEEKVRSIAEKVEGVLATEKCRIRKSGMSYYVDLHTIVDAEITVALGHQIGHNLKDKIKKEMPEVADVLVHIEPYHCAIASKEISD